MVAQSPGSKVGGAFLFGRNVFPSAPPPQPSLSSGPEQGYMPGPRVITGKRKWDDHNPVRTNRSTSPPMGLGTVPSEVGGLLEGIRRQPGSHEQQGVPTRSTSASQVASRELILK